jgi:hypothetical protein
MRLDFCVLCGCNDPSALEHHHYIPKVDGGTDDEWNMFTICGLCHGVVHAIPRPLRLRELSKKGKDKAKNNLHYHIRRQNKTIGKRIRILTALAESLGRGDIVDQVLNQLETKQIDYRKIFFDIQKIFNMLGEIVPSSEMLNELQMLENPEYNWLEFDGKPLTISALTRFLNSLFNVNTRLSRFQKKVCRVYMQKDFDSALKRLAVE